MSDTPHREPPPGTKRHYARPGPEMTDEEIDTWANQFVERVLGESGEQGDDPGGLVCRKETLRSECQLQVLARVSPRIDRLASATQESEWFPRQVR